MEIILNNVRTLSQGFINACLDLWEYGNPNRIAFQLLIVTGMREMCLNNVFLANFREYNGQILLAWYPSKCGKSPRMAVIPPELFKEIKKMRETNKVYYDRLLPFTSDSFRRYFNKARQRLPPEYNEKIPRFYMGRWRDEYIYQLKATRKNYASLLLNRYMKATGSIEMAMEFTRQEMKHSEKVTFHHYTDSAVFGKTTIHPMQQIEKQDFQTRL